MEEHDNDIDLLLSDAGDFIETRTTLFKLKAVESLSEVSSDLVAGLGLLSILAIFLLILTIGFALLIGDWMGKGFYGFFIMGGVYAVVGIIVYLGRKRWLKAPFSNMLIRKIFNK
jgi:Putative Actinobacterial Holin-X, holin superfamily III